MVGVDGYEKSQKGVANRYEELEKRQSGYSRMEQEKGCICSRGWIVEVISVSNIGSRDDRT